jgi:RNA 3'-terminal phosphate cyclase (ATP)
MTMLTLDGSTGEGGGQILRTALALALVTGQPFRIDNIRKKRNKPGLLRQHLTCVEAARDVSDATVDGGELSSLTLQFKPGKVKAGTYEFAVGTAGSTTLVLQTLLPALLRADAPSRLVLRGGTHNPFAPPFDFLAQTFAPLLQRMRSTTDPATDVLLSLQLTKLGFYPAGGGCILADITPGTLHPFELLQRGDHAGFVACAAFAHLPRSVADRELAIIDAAGIPGPGELRVQQVADSVGPGNALTLALRFAHITEVVTAFGERGVRAEDVAERAVQAAFAYLHHDAPVGEHLADQLLLPLALAGGGVFRSGAPSSHTRTNAAVIEKMLPVKVRTTPEAGQTWRIELASR